MDYRAKDMPAWVRFRTRPVPKPVYTVPTRMEHMIALTVQADTARLDRLVRALTEVSWFGAAPAAPLRVMLPLDYGREGRE